MSRDIATQFGAVAARFPDRPAIAHASQGKWERWSYLYLAGRVEATAARLRAAGVGPGGRVAILAKRHPETIAALLAVLAVGAAYVPIDPRDPEARVGALQRAACCSAVVRIRDDVEIGGLDGLTPDGWPAHPEPGHCTVTSGPTPASDRDGNHPAYVIFTSGSTGEPKGVVVPHRAVLRLVQGQSFLTFGPERVFLQSVPLAFDASVLDLFGALLHGGCCVLFPDDRLPTPAGLREAITSNAVTTANLTTSLFHVIVDEDVGCLAGLSELIVGGETMSFGHVQRALAALPGTQIVNGYGPTENGVVTTAYRLPRRLASQAQTVPIGALIAGTVAWVVDDALQPVPDGVPGELVVAGEGLALGYLGDPTETRAKFVDLPIAGAVVRAFRTGDCAARRADGIFEFFGRLDQQVKISGHRVHPSEPEHLIGSLDGVQHCCVVPCIDPGGTLRLVAYLVLRPGGTARQVESAAAMALPPYLVPARFVEVRAMPLGVNGKIDRRALPTPWGTGDPGSTRPGRGLGARLASAWTQVLGRIVEADDVGFFDAGGRSLDAVRLHDLIERASGQRLDPTFVYEFPTLGSQLRALQGRLASGT